MITASGPLDVKGGISMKMTENLEPQRAADPFMEAALEEAYVGIARQDGGPFGAVVVKDGVIVGRGHNRVLRDNDPTCHGEVAAIRDACARLGTYDLSGCELYTTGEPCPMCLYACLWAKVERVYYGCTLEDNSLLGFRDSALNELGDGRDKLTDFLVCRDRAACQTLFQIYRNGTHTIY